MVALVKDNLKAIQDAGKKHHGLSLYLVGGATQNDRFTGERDIDFLYRFRKGDIVRDDYADNFFDLMFFLQDLLNRKADLVAKEKMWNRYFIESINRSKQLIFES